MASVGLARRVLMAGLAGVVSAVTVMVPGAPSSAEGPALPSPSPTPSVTAQTGPESSLVPPQAPAPEATPTGSAQSSPAQKSPLPRPEPATDQASSAPAPSTGQSESSSSPAPAAVVPGSQVDVTINVSGPASGAAGTAYTYTVIVGNNSLPDADGAAFTVTMPASSTNVSASCAAAGGASCPAALTTTNSQVKGTAGLLPHNGSLTITITGRFAAPSASSVTCRGTVTAPAGTTDYDLTSNTSSVATAVTSAAGIVVGQTQTSQAMAPGTPNTYTLTWTNNGPASADGTVTLAMMYFRTDVYDHANITGFTCTASGGLVCPTTTASSVSGYYGAIFSQTQASFPAGATMTVTYTADLVPASPQACGASTLSIGNDVRATLPQGFTNVGTSDLFIYATAPGTSACPTTDVAVTKTQDSATIAPGSPVTYTVTYRNVGPGAANGASLNDALYFATPVQSLSTHILSCNTTGGAVCPTLTDTTVTTSGRYAIQTTAPTFPAGSTIRVVYSAEMTLAANPTCSAGGSTVENRATIAVPAGVVEVGNQPNQASVFATAPAPPICPRAALAVTKTVDKTTLFPGDPTTYTITYTNRGPDAADGAWITDYLDLYPARFINSARVTIESCLGTGGASCPSFIADKTVANSSYLWSGSIGAFPNGATLTIVVSLDPIAGGSSCPTSSATVPNTATIALPAGMTGSNGNSGPINVTAACADISVNKSLVNSSVQRGDPVTYNVKVSNASSGAARSVQFTDPLPIGFVFGSATCTPSSATSTCANPSYNPATRTLSAIIPLVGPNQGFVTITISGVAGPVGGTYSNTASAGSLTTGADRFIDPVQSSNSSTAVLTIFGTASKVTVTKHLTGLPAGGVPAPLTFTGTISCDFEGVKPWTVTVPAGASSASSTLLFYDGQQCTVAENPARNLPPGFTWIGPPVIEPSTLSIDGPSGQYGVTVTNRLTPNAALTLAKTVSRSQATAGQQVTFTYQVTNGGPIPVSGPVIHELSFSGTGTLAPAICPAGELAPDESVECSTTYTITADDVATGLLTNVAYATATPSAGPVPQTAPATASVRLVTPPALTLTKNATPTTFSAVGDQVEYSYLVTNTGGLPLTAPTITESAFSGSGDAPQPTCPDSGHTLAVGEQITCTASYRVTQADLDRGTVTNTAIATASAPEGFEDPETSPATATVQAAQEPSITLAKSVFPISPLAFMPGATLTYSFVVTNTGNVTLTGLRIDDAGFTGTGELGAIVCEASTLAPGDETICSTTYQITDADLGAGSLVNTATATADPPVGPPVTSRGDTATVPDASAPAIDVTKHATPAIVHQAGETIHYTYEVTNTGNVPLTDPAVIEVSFTGTGPVPEPTCPVGSILPGETVTCAADYTITPADLRAAAIVNTATGAVIAPSGAVVNSEPSTASTDVVAGIPGITLHKSASPASISAAGQQIVYTFDITNSGQTPLTDVAVQESDFSGTGTAPQITCPAEHSLAVNARLVCTARYTVTQADVDAGSVVNTAQVTARFADAAEADPLEASDSVEVPVDTQASLTLIKSASPAGLDAFVPGQQITYTFVVTNTGNVTLTDWTIVEGEFTGAGELSSMQCPDRAALAPGEQVTCTVRYTLTAADVEAGQVSNTAQAIALPPVGDPVDSANASVDLPVAPSPGLRLVKSASPGAVHAAGDEISYSFTVTNTGDVTVRDLRIVENRFTGSGPLVGMSCPGGTLAPGQTMTCRARYVVTATDVQLGLIDNTAVATGTYGVAGDDQVAQAAGDARPGYRGSSGASASSAGAGGEPLEAAVLAAAAITTAPSSARVEIEPAPAPAPTRDGSVNPPGGHSTPGGQLSQTGAQIALATVFAAGLLAVGLALVRSRGHRRRLQ